MSENQQLMHREQTAAAVMTTPDDLLSMAVAKGASLEQLEKLMDLKERWEKNEARKAFVSAMNAFKKNPPSIVKDRHVRYESSKGVTEYDHASLFGVTNAVIEGLSKHGVSHRWDVKQENGAISVVCVLTHELGHSESVSMTAPPDQSGGKNNIQAIASTVSYLQRYTLLAATGLSSKDMDNDGRGDQNEPSVSEEQAANIKALIDEVGANEANFLRFMKADSIASIRASQYDSAIKALEAKRKANGR